MIINESTLCFCGSGKKYLSCCGDRLTQQHGAILEELAQVIAMNPSLTVEELNVIFNQKAAEKNSQPCADFLDLTPNQMANWMYAPFAELEGIEFHVPEDLSACPVMCYLRLIIETMLTEGGALKATVRGNLPAKLVKHANALLPGFTVSQHQQCRSISEFAGSNEGQFNALHYTRILAELTGIIYFKQGHFHLNKRAGRRYQQQSLPVFYLPLLETALRGFNWGYFDRLPDELPLAPFGLFMLWRLHFHGSVERLITEMEHMLSDLTCFLVESGYFSPKQLLSTTIETRFILRFLAFFGFAVAEPGQLTGGEWGTKTLTRLPLFSQTFRFLL